MLNKRQKKTLITSQTSISKDNNILWQDTIPLRRTIMRVVTAAVELHTMAFPSVNGLLLNEDYVAQMKEDYTRHNRNIDFSHVSFSHDVVEGPKSSRDVVTNTYPHTGTGAHL